MLKQPAHKRQTKSTITRAHFSWEATPRVPPARFGWVWASLHHLQKDQHLHQSEYTASHWQIPSALLLLPCALHRAGAWPRSPTSCCDHTHLCASSTPGSQVSHGTLRNLLSQPCPAATAHRTRSPWKASNAFTARSVLSHRKGSRSKNGPWKFLLLLHATDSHWKTRNC